MMTRRTFILRSSMAASAPFLSACAPGSTPETPSTLIAYVGSRTTRERNARGRGITVWRVDQRTGSWEQIQLVEAEDGDPATSGNTIPVNPSFFTLDGSGRFLYAVHGDATQVSAFALDPATGHLTLVNMVDTGRRNPVHLSLDPSGRWLVVAHLAPPGSVTSLPIRGDGSLGAVTGVLELPGTPGPHKSAQVGPNPHHTPFDLTGRWIVIPDRGLDRVFVAQLDPATGRLTLNDPGWATTRELDGPRHVAFHPGLPYAYVVNELRSTVTTYRWDAMAGTLTAQHVVSSTAPEMIGDSRGAEIAVAPSGRFVYASNRSGAGDSTPGGPEQDTIGVFRADERTGNLSPVGWVSTGGIRPRYFTFDPDGQRLYALNEVSDSVVGFTVDHDSGLLHPTGEVVATGSPVCLVIRRLTGGA
jgi:6-phosphogluconolactonase